MTGERATVIRAADTRAILIAELLRLGHPVADVVEALKHTDAGDLEGAIRVLTQMKERRQ